MPNTSATGGPLLPNEAVLFPLEDQQLDRFFQQFVVGLTGLDPTLVRPRWQPEPINLPENDVDWCAVGVMDTLQDANAYIRHVCENETQGDGYDVLIRHEDLHLLASFYGPDAWAFATRMRDGLEIGQNREVLQKNAMGFVRCANPFSTPELIKERWQRRVDLGFTIRRAVGRRYDVMNLKTGVFSVDSDVTVVTDTAP